MCHGYFVFPSVLVVVKVWIRQAFAFINLRRHLSPCCYLKFELISFIHTSVGVVHIHYSCLVTAMPVYTLTLHDDVIKWKHFPRYWPFVQGIHRSPTISPHKGQWHGALMFSLICAWINNWINNREAGDLWHHRAHYDITVMERWLSHKQAHY